MGHLLPYALLAAVLISTTTTPSAADAITSLTACDYPSLAEQIPHLGNFEAILNGEQHRLDCTSGFKPTEQAQYARCIEGTWEWTRNFRCIPSAFCLLMFEPQGPAHKVLHSSHEKRTQFGNDVFADNEGVVVKCRADGHTHAFTCKGGSWEPDMSSTPCKPSICKQVAELANGGFRRVSADIIEPFCSEGYQLKGSATVFCVENKWTVRKSFAWPYCERNEVLRTPSSPFKKYQWIAISAGAVILLIIVMLLLWCHLRRDSPKRNRLMHQTSHVDELLHLRRTKPIVIPEPVAHTQVHYTHDRKPIPVTSL